MSAELIQAVVAGLFGAILGSFLNVVVYRLPRNESVVTPRSRCPKCGAMVAWYDNVPVVSWLVLRGRCRHCANPISVQYPMVEATVALTWGLSLHYLGATWEALSAAVFVTLLLGILLTDAQHFIIPDELSLGGLAVGMAFAIMADVSALPVRLGLVALYLFTTGLYFTAERRVAREAAALPAGHRLPAAHPTYDLVVLLPVVVVWLAHYLVQRLQGAPVYVSSTVGFACAGALTGFGLLWLVKTAGDMALRRGWIGGQEITETLGADEPLSAMGGGDLKMMAMIGSFLGWRGVILTVFLGALTGTVVYLPFLFRKKKPLVPFGIYLALGAFVTLLAGTRLAAWYALFVEP